HSSKPGLPCPLSLLPRLNSSSRESRLLPKRKIPPSTPGSKSTVKIFAITSKKSPAALLPVQFLPSSRTTATAPASPTSLSSSNLSQESSALPSSSSTKPSFYATRAFASPSCFSVHSTSKILPTSSGATFFQWCTRLSALHSTKLLPIRKSPFL